MALLLPAAAEYSFKLVRGILGVGIGHDAQVVVLGPEAIYFALATGCVGFYTVLLQQSKLLRGDGCGKLGAKNLLVLYAEGIYKAAGAHI